MSNLNNNTIKKMKPNNSTNKVSPADKALVQCPSPAIGIDLGTTYSCVGTWQHEHDGVKIIANEQGNRTTPSCVAFTERKTLVGDTAKNQAASNPANVIYDAKRLIGKPYKDAAVQDDMKLWPFKVIPGPITYSLRKPMIVVSLDGEEKQFAAKEISSMVLLRMKENAEVYLGSAVNNAVVTVPAYFNDSQRQATKDAAANACLDSVYLLDEPIAAAIACGFDKKLSSSPLAKNVLIFDLGGGTFDVTLLTKKHNFFHVKAINGESHLGGRDFDNRLLSYILEEFREKHGKDISTSPKSLERLRASCERAKRILSSDNEATIEIDCLFEGLDFSITVTRSQFEELNMDLFEKCMECVDKCLKDGKAEKSDISTIVLVGGSTRIPKVQQLLQDLFTGKDIYRGMNAEEAVAYGAAILSAVLRGNHSKLSPVLAGCITPSSLGIEVRSGPGNMSTVVPRSTKFPTTIRKDYKTSVDNQTKVRFSVYEGEKRKVKENQLLGEFVLCDVPAAPKGVPTIDVCFDLNADGILTVTAQLRGTNNMKSLRLPVGTLDIEKVIEAAKSMAECDGRMMLKSKGPFTKFFKGLRKALKLIF